MKFRVGYTSQHPFDATLDSESEWRSEDVESETAAMAEFRAEYPSACVDYVLPVEA